jgi:hypothetical protein
MQTSYEEDEKDEETNGKGDEGRERRTEID